eukprot:CAMPEP_0198118116 /NCGR_PEP_ID=MMETSP1442-20131203/20426_1 /TAXON_ID= /ORGANISM="Craspedostauros australis, Strain CCMP3328" /LENGTH=80 /DNA_ID=CAMNT_0043776315 /DNA_START=181 /DNA_END=423 /DNA_ORIENTATION=+
MDAVDFEISSLASNPVGMFGNIAMNGDEYVRCARCGYGGCDVRVAGCGCVLHAVSPVLVSTEVAVHPQNAKEQTQNRVMV